jgi:2-polyprenyl-3-methyl-5-hydroxy-6-metoxy-1,4-benzoquinol methylase
MPKNEAQVFALDIKSSKLSVAKKKKKRSGIAMEVDQTENR